MSWLWVEESGEAEGSLSRKGRRMDAFNGGSSGFANGRLRVLEEVCECGESSGGEGAVVAENSQV